jgi:hypothetical protein
LVITNYLWKSYTGGKEILPNRKKTLLNSQYRLVLFVLFILFVFMMSAPSLLSQLQNSQVPKNDTTTKTTTAKLLVKNPEGTEFWLCFEKNYKEPKPPNPPNPLHLELFITSDNDAKVKIEIKGINFKQEVFVPGKTVQNVKIPSEAEIKSEEIKEQLAVHVTSDNPISVYGLNRRFQTTDTYMGLPTDVLGTEYRVMCYRAQDDLLPQFAVVATENGTEIKITPTVNTITLQAKKTFTIKLDRGEVYQVAGRKEQMSKEDLTGSLIVANKKIAVFSGHQCAYVPQHIHACNHLVEQMPPIPSWGKHFYIGRLQSRSFYTYRVLANEANTRIFEDAKLIKTLGAGEFFENSSNRNIQITADKPILVAQFSQGMKNGDSIGDPMMILISPTQQFLQKYRFATPVNGSWKHFINVVAPLVSTSTIRLNGKPLDVKFQQLGISRYGIAFIKIPYGTHVIEGSLPFGLYSYGFGDNEDAFDAYGNMGGQSFMDYEPAEDTIPPAGEMTSAVDEALIIIRDDRVDDTGLREVNFISNDNLSVNSNVLETGAPQYSFVVKPSQRNSGGRLLVEAVDVAFNKTLFTICYYFNPKKNRMEFSMNEGVVESCDADPGWNVGVFGRFAACFHSPDFSHTGAYTTEGKFSETFGVGGYGGIYVGRRFFSNISFSGRLALTDVGGTLSAIDTTISKVRTSDGSLKSFQESSLLKLDAVFLNAAFAAEYYISPNLYLLGGLEFSFPLTSAIKAEREILIPDDFSYPDNTRKKADPNAPSTLGSLSAINTSALFGAGFSYTFDYKISAFFESYYSLPFGSIINDGDWKIPQLVLQLGLKYRVF